MTMWHKLLRSNRKLTVLSLLLVGIVMGVVGTVSFDATMEWSNTDSFCLGCHNHEIPYQQLQATVHYRNAHGVVASCSSCHVPHESLPKLLRKVEATKELLSHIQGVIDSDEKYLAHVDEMKRREVSRFKANDSGPCRHCHKVERMDLAWQSSQARKEHQELSEGKTCIDCHQGIAHTPLKE